MAALAITDTADGRRILALTGRLDAKTLPELWDKTRRAADEAATRPVVVDASGIEYCDGAGVALFVAGLIPGSILTTMLCVVTWFIARKRDYPRVTKATWAETMKAFRDSVWGLMLVVIIIGGMRAGASKEEQKR